MNNAWTLATNGFAAGWGAQMLRACAQGTLLAACIWLLCRFVPRLSAATRVWLWWLVCLKLLIGLFWITPVSLALLPTPKRPSAPTLHAYSGMRAGDTNNASTMRFPHSAQEIVLPIAPLSEVRRSLPQTSSVHLSLSLAAACLGLWLVGVSFRFGGAFRQLLVVSRLTRRTRPLQTAEINTTASQIAEDLGLRFVPGLRVSDMSVDPLAVGPLRPQVVIAQSTLDRLTPEELRSLLAHEFAHIRRGDLWLGIVPLLAENLFFFLPPVWLACREFAVVREAACDAAAVRATDTPPSAYGHLLLKLGDLRTDLCPTGALAATSNFHMLQRRIVMLQDVSRVSGRRFAGSAFALSLIAVAGLVPWRIVAAQEHNAQAKISVPAVSTPTPPTESVASYNPGSHTDWSQYPTEPMNLDFTSGLDHWQNISESGTEKQYQIGYGSAAETHGFAMGFVKAVSLEAQNGDGNLIQKVRADKWRGKRLRLSASVKSTGATTGAFLILHLDQPDKIRVWGGDKPVRGSTAWLRREVVVDVPTDSQGIIFGLNLIGKGSAQIGEIRFEEVSKDIPVSKPSYSSDDSEETDSMTAGLPTTPVNPDFKKGLDGWANDNPDHTTYNNYRIGLDSHEKRNGVTSAYLTNKVEKPHSYGTLMQNINPKEYRGKRVRLSADMKTQDVENYAGMWLVMMRTNKDGAAWHSAMNLKGTTDWTHYSYVVDVPDDANFFSFGLALEDRGKIWVNPFHLEVVGKDVPVTSPTQDGTTEQWKGNTARVVALWQLGRKEKYAELKTASEAIVNDPSAMPEERATAREALAYALNALHDTAGAKSALDKFEEDAKTLTIDEGVVAEAKRLRAGLK